MYIYIYISLSLSLKICQKFLYTNELWRRIQTRLNVYYYITRVGSQQKMH